MSLSDRIVAAIKNDFTDRRGLRHAWDDIDEDIKVEILATWKDLVEKELASASATPADDLRSILLTVDGKGRQAKEAALEELLRRARREGPETEQRWVGDGGMRVKGQCPL